MAKKQTRRSISVSRGTYERLKAYCETNQISMSQFVERRVGDYLGRSGADSQPMRVSGAQASSPRASSPQASSPQASSLVQQAAVPAPRVPQPMVQPDAFSVSPVAQAVPTRPSAINQPISQAVAAPTPAPKPASDEPMLKDPDAKLTADQIFTF